MTELDQKRREWNSQQKVIRSSLEKPVDFDRAIRMYLDHHAMLHDPLIGNGKIWSFDRILWDSLDEDAVRKVPPKFEHSIVWLIWHIARCEDAAFNIAVRNGQQVLVEGNWTERMGISAADSGNAMDEDEILVLSREIYIPALRAYRLAVGQQTREIVMNLTVGDLKKSGGTAALERYRTEGVVLEPAWGIAEYWSNSTAMGLMLMPATRHNMVHLNEAFKIKKKLVKK